MTRERSLLNVSLRFAGASVLLGVLAIAACNRAPTPPQKMAITPAQPGTAAGLAIFRQDKDADRNQEASDNRFTVTTAYAFIDRSSPEYYDIVLLDKPLDNQKLAEAADPADPINEALRAGANGAWIMADGEGDISGSFKIHVNGKSTQYGGSGIGQVRGLARKGDRVSGHLHYFNSSFADHIGIDASFDAPLIVAPKGTPMPADGGEPGEAYLATVAAMRAGDFDKLVALMPADRAKMMAAEKDKPDFAQNMEMLKAMAPEEVQVTGGTSYGERVMLETKGTSGKAPFTGTVEMNWQDGGWRMGSTSERMGSSGSESAAKTDAPKEPHADEPPPADSVPVLVDAGIVGKGFMRAGEDFSPTDAFITTMPVEYGENRMLMVFSADKLEPKNAKATWDDDTPLEKLFVDGKAHPALWVNLSREEDGEVKMDKAYFVDLEGNVEDAYMGFNAIESDGKLLGLLTQEGSINEVKYAGIARFNLAVLPSPTP